MKSSSFPCAVVLIVVLAIIGFAGSILIVYRASAEEIITIATLEYAPWTGKNLKSNGFVNHVITEAFQREGYTVKYTYLPWKRGVTETKRGEYSELSYVYWAPVEFVDEDGEFKAISIDYLKRLSKILGVEFQFKKDVTWQQAMAAVDSGELDMFSSVARTPKRENRYNFTAPYETDRLHIGIGVDASVDRNCQCSRTVDIHANYGKSFCGG